MNNPLVEKIERELEQLGIRGAQMLRERYDEQCFGNALAVYKLGNLYLVLVPRQLESPPLGVSV